MQTTKSFLMMAALAPLARPLARAAARTGQPCRTLADCLPNRRIETFAGRELHFHPDLVPGRLVVADMLYACRSAILGPNGAAAPTDGADPDLFLYALTEQPAPALQSELRRTMRSHARERAGAFALDGAAGVDVLRTRLVLLDNAPRAAPLAWDRQGRQDVPPAGAGALVVPDLDLAARAWAALMNAAGPRPR